MRGPNFIAYLRVSTDRQGRSGLGLDAQRQAVNAYVIREGGRLVATFEEIESGKKADRPQLAAALAACRAMRARLVIAKLDRLARNVHFISGLMESGVDFVACDMPHASRLTIHILAAMAEHEREQISARTKAALAAAKKRRIRLGNPALKPGTSEAAQRAALAKSRIAAKRTEEILPLIEQAREAGAVTLREIAAALTARGIVTPSGRRQWHPQQVTRMLRQSESEPLRLREAI
jgi:DNA invertase Pin-like site-specific DNA recombinase